MKQLYTTILSALLFSSAFSQSTGFLPPTATAAPNGWTNPANAYASDDQWASVAHGSGCRCPFIYLSWNGGTNYTSSQLLGPFGTTDQTATAGSPTDTWGHAWTDVELSNTNFRLKIANPSTLIEQGWSTFNFNIPTNATINGIEVKLEWHGDANFTMEFLDQAMINVYYTAVTGETELLSLSANMPVFPNPTTGKVQVNFKGESSSRFSLLNIQGEIMMDETISSVNSVSIDLSSFPKGIYFLQLVTNEGLVTKKIVLQ
jgi:hypothetical protein